MLSPMSKVVRLSPPFLHLHVRGTRGMVDDAIYRLAVPEIESRRAAISSRPKPSTKSRRLRDYKDAQRQMKRGRSNDGVPQ